MVWVFGWGGGRTLARTVIRRGKEEGRRAEGRPRGEEGGGEGGERVTVTAPARGDRRTALVCYAAIVLAIVGRLRDVANAGAVSLDGFEGPHNGWLVIIFGADRPGRRRLAVPRRLAGGRHGARLRRGDDLHGGRERRRRQRGPRRKLRLGGVANDRRVRRARRGSPLYARSSGGSEEVRKPVPEPVLEPGLEAAGGEPGCDRAMSGPKTRSSNSDATAGLRAIIATS